MKHNEVISTSFTNNGTLITAKVPSYFKNKYFEYLQNNPPVLIKNKWVFY